MIFLLNLQAFGLKILIEYQYKITAAETAAVLISDGITP